VIKNTINQKHSPIKNYFVFLFNFLGPPPFFSVFAFGEPKVKKKKKRKKKNLSFFPPFFLSCPTKTREKSFSGPSKKKPLNESN